MEDLEALMAHIKRVWVCDPNRYPALAGMNEAQHLNFLVTHSLKHITKTSGKIAAVSEAFDHTNAFAEGDDVLLQDLAIKLFVNALKLAEGVGLTSSVLLARAPDYVS